MSSVDAGRIHLRLRLQHGRIADAALASERPAVTRALRGRAADEVVRLIPLLYAVCGRAQGRAAALAVAAARGEEKSPTEEPEIAAEAMREHLWRWLLDLPRLVGGEALQAEFSRGVACLARDARVELGEMLAGPHVSAVRSGLDALEAGSEMSTRLLPTLDAVASVAEWPRLNAEFSLRPQWQGAPAETGAQARSGIARASLAGRWRQRFAELESWSRGETGVGAVGTASAIAVAPGVGRAAVETARGLLLHEVALDDERVADYVIVAPTEWNFHPQGMLATWLAGLDASDAEALKRRIEFAVASFDPCVGWEVEGI